MRALSSISRPALALISILGSGIAAPALLAQSYVAPPAAPLTAVLPIIVEKADTTR